MKQIIPPRDRIDIITNMLTDALLQLERIRNEVKLIRRKLNLNQKTYNKKNNNNDSESGK